ncbi:30S ribosomal protein S18 [Candidatus Margulisiibacteriota bacterium]
MAYSRDRKDRREKNERREKKPFKKRRIRPCLFCEGKTVDYKDVPLVKHFISDRGKILPGRITGCCTRHQRKVAKLVKRARHAGLIIYSGD